MGNELYANTPSTGATSPAAPTCSGARTLPEASKANKDSFFYTNITPEHEAFNQSGASGIWGELENAVFSEVDVENLRVVVKGESKKVFAKSPEDFHGA